MPMDPVCGRVIDKNTSFKERVDDDIYYFCSEECMEEFDLDPDIYMEQSREFTSTEEW